MAVNVGPTVVSPSHHFSLSDGTKTLGLINCNQKGQPDPISGWRQMPMPRTAMKISQGSEGYQDFELPFTSIEMQDWYGGINAENFEEDTSRYRDGRRIDTTRGDIICGPKATQATSLITTPAGDLSYNNNYSFGGPGSVHKASPFTPASNITVNNIAIVVGESLETISVYIYADAGGGAGPGSLLGSGTVSSPGTGVITISLSSAVSLIAGTQYYISFYLYTSSLARVVYPYYTRDDAGNSVWTYTTSWAKTIDDETIAFMLNNGGGITEVGIFKFFEHRRCVYAVGNFDDSSAPKLYRNGYRGCGKSNSANKSKLNTDQDLSGVDLAGCIALIIEGPGVDEEQPWRVIASNTTTGTNDVITVEQPWYVTHTTATSFVILGSDDWVEITGHGLTGRVTDVEIIYDYVAFAQGDSINIRQFRWINSSGTSTNQFRDDGTNKADYLLAVANTEGTMKLWGALVDDNQVDSADAVYYGSDHAFSGQPITIGSSKYDDIKGMVAYGDPLIPYIFKENSFGSIQNDIYAEIPVGEMAAIRSEYNGIASMKHNVYLYFNLAEKIQQYYDRRLTSVGPDLDEGLPEGRQGIVRKLMPYPGRYYAMLYSDGGVPSILCNNGYGWHEIWRATSVSSDGSGATGEAAPFAYNVVDNSNVRCNDMIIQTVPGAAIDRLWFDLAGEIYWVPIAINPQRDSNYEYADLCQLETAWIYGNLKDVIKYWHSVKIHSENLSGSEDTSQIIKVEYKVDNDDDWTTAGYINTSPIDELDLSSSYNVTGYRIKFRFTLHTADSKITPRIVAIVVKGVIRVETKKGWSVIVLVQPDFDLDGKAEIQSGILDQLDTWANSDLTAAPLLMRNNIPYYDNKYVFIEPASIIARGIELEAVKGQSKRNTVHVASFTMYEV